jgi:hypothetical protein
VNVRRCACAIAWKAASGSATTSCGSGSAGFAVATSAAARAGRLRGRQKFMAVAFLRLQRDKHLPGRSWRVSTVKPVSGETGDAVQRPPVHAAN